MTGEVLTAGVDEAGRGPLAGPVVAAAVILDPVRPVAGLTDSKLLDARRREGLASQIRERALGFALGRAEVQEIDDLNILRASLLAMQRAVQALRPPPLHAVIDGLHAPALACTVHTMVKADLLVPAVSAASILAKVARDAEMLALHEHYPVYGFARHKGYPTREHLAALRAHGACAVHRRSFAPVRRLCTPT